MLKLGSRNVDSLSDALRRGWGGAFCKSVSLSNSLSETDFRFPSPWVRFQTEIFVEELAFDLEFENVRCVTWLFKKFISTILC
jgi:hypothetical protein